MMSYEMFWDDHGSSQSAKGERGRSPTEPWQLRIGLLTYSFRGRAFIFHYMRR